METRLALFSSWTSFYNSSLDCARNDVQEIRQTRPTHRKLKKIRKARLQTNQTRDGGGGQGPHLREQDLGRTIGDTGERERGARESCWATADVQKILFRQKLERWRGSWRALWRRLARRLGCSGAGGDTRATRFDAAAKSERLGPRELQIRAASPLARQIQPCRKEFERGSSAADGGLPGRAAATKGWRGCDGCGGAAGCGLPAAGEAAREQQLAHVARLPARRRRHGHVVSA